MLEATIKPTSCIWMGNYSDLPDRGEWQIGWTYYAGFNKGSGGLSNHFLKEVQQIRKPIVVMCPALSHWEDGSQPDRLYPTPFCIDSHATMEGNNPDKAWIVTVDLSSLIKGQKPIITVSPSIHLVGIWHGWLEDGILHN